MFKRILKGFALLLIVVIGAFLLVVGPWPTYGPSDIASSGKVQAVLTAIDESAEQTDITATPGALQAGWGKGSIIPRVGIPLAGYGDRQGKPSQGIRNELYAKALVLSDGQDTVAIVGSDMLIVPENVTEVVRERVAAETGLDPSAIYFNASHTHSGPGGFGPGFVANMFMGAYDESVPGALVDGFVKAIVDAYGQMAPAEMAARRLEAPEYIRNRARDEGVDPVLNYMIFKHADGKRCVVSRYSAHSTVLGGDNMYFSGDYPGFLMSTLEAQPDTFAIFLAGAMGSMGPKAPEAPDAFARAEAMGTALALKIIDDAANATFQANVDLAWAATGFKTPSFQIRLTQKLRVSPFLPRLGGLDNDAWIHGLRIGDQFLYGTPCDFSGELSAEYEQWAQEQGLTLWVTSFNGDYIGYISPAKYYSESEPGGRDSYEMYVMSWFGPDQEAWFTLLLHHLVEKLKPAAAEPAAA